MNRSVHAAVRAQQRCIPPLVEQWLNQFGEEKHDGHGGVLRYFSRASIRAMERAFGRAPVRKMSEYLDAYKVESSHDGDVLTIGHRTKRIKRR
ncbi:hypothetical protein SAMN05216386_2968 [Nitrosospira briensis]|uniref:Uncharacterized protein n=1 Tax=Nitrosospira briensis TaxID=35799 RepID=A0A1I5FCY7_9PROT|nr:hypothetical protein [Nitrosospira briensis]SFO21628.1 hypothetical protein SAMN05216386_2968 [Nitrosospira briensis]